LFLFLKKESAFFFEKKKQKTFIRCVGAGLLTPRAHVIGAGLAGLSAATALTDAGWAVTVYEAGPAAGGRCRSYFDRALDCRIDNGNHLLLSGNHATMAYLERIGARDTLGGPGAPVFPFCDVATGARWTLRPSAGRIPWWIFSPRRRVPGTRAPDYLVLRRLLRAGPGATVAGVLGGSGALYRDLLEPLAIAALNTPPETALASLLGRVVEETLMRGGGACVPLFPREGLSESLVDPALAWLAARGAEVLTGRRIAGLRIEGGRVTALETPDGTVGVGAGEAVVLAVPPWVATDLLPGLPAPDAFEAIANVHFRRDGGDHPVFMGVLGGTAEWIFSKKEVLSVTISAANRLAEVSGEELAARSWTDIQRALGVRGAMPAMRVVREKRATFAATAASEARRPGPLAGLDLFAVAGDWTATGLPATIEGAIRSGRTAANTLISR
jgi:squalene-associated FAD-dependent desaturase